MSVATVRHVHCTVGAGSDCQAPVSFPSTPLPMTGHTPSPSIAPFHGWGRVYRFPTQIFCTRVNCGGVIIGRVLKVSTVAAAKTLLGLGQVSNRSVATLTAYVLPAAPLVFRSRNGRRRGGLHSPRSRSN